MNATLNVWVSSVLAAANPYTDNATALWNWQGTPFIVGASLFVLLVASRTIQQPHVGPKAPLGPLAPLFNNISLAGFIASISFGHILGVLLVLSFANYLKS